MDRTSRYLIISKENKSKKNIHSDIHKLLQSINDTTGLSCDKNLVSVQGRSFRYELKMMNTDSQEDNKKFFVLIFYLEKSQISNSLSSWIVSLIILLSHTII